MNRVAVCVCYSRGRGGWRQVAVAGWDGVAKSARLLFGVSRAYDSVVSRVVSKTVMNFSVGLPPDLTGESISHAR